MIAARALLQSGQNTVSATGYEVGYESPTHFSRDYSRKFGVAPSTHILHGDLVHS
jgi:AraC-like DNA-binding protein